MTNGHAFTMRGSRKKRKPTKWEKALRKLRATLGLSQAKAAKRLGVATRTWIFWENYPHNPGPISAQLLRVTFPDHDWPCKS